MNKLKILMILSVFYTFGINAMDKESIDRANKLLVAGIKVGSINYIKKAIAAKADVNHLSEREYGATPLSIAAQFGNCEVVKLLLDSGANKDQGDNNKGTALHVAMEHGKVELIPLLVSKKNIFKAMGNRSTFYFAMKNSQIPLMIDILGQGYNINNDELIKNINHYLVSTFNLYNYESKFDQVIHYIIRDQRINKFLCDSSARAKDINTIYKHGVTLLMLAAARGKVEVVSDLLDYTHKPDIFALNHDGYSAYCFANKFGHKEVAKILSAYIADIPGIIANQSALPRPLVSLIFDYMFLHDQNKND